ncbi:uncharacterized protein [Antedon mediterranea]|uniref:uncharacterized protein isoform X2 n=1 Tax=Antedon mediterranea TaxID=105859 RepID=UPI003AF72F69
MSSYNIYGSNSSQGNGSVGLSSRSSLTSDREPYSSRIRNREIDNGNYEETTSRISALRSSPRYRRNESKESTESKKMQNLGEDEAGGAEVACSSPSQRLKERKGASSSPRSGKFANRRMREKRRGTGKVVVEDDGFMDELAKENAVKNAMIPAPGNDYEEQSSPVMSRDQQKDDEDEDSVLSRVEKRRAARQRRQMQEEESNSLSSNDRPNRDRQSGEVSTLKEDLSRERDEKGALLKAMTNMAR